MVHTAQHTRKANTRPPICVVVVVVIVVVDRFYSYIALFSALEQTHCARMWFYVSKHGA